MDSRKWKTSSTFTRLGSTKLRFLYFALVIMVWTVVKGPRRPFQLQRASQHPNTHVVVRSSCTNSEGVNITTPVDCNTERVTTTEHAFAFLHVAGVPGYEHIVVDELLALERSGVYDTLESLTICTVGKVNIRKLLSQFQRDRFSKVKVENLGSKVDSFELPTLNYVLEFARKSQKKRELVHVLYIHTKGSFSETGAYVPKWYWRQVMQHWLLFKHEYARRLLTYGYDAVGVNAVRGHVDISALVRGNDIHFSGNFWWATSQYLSTLDDLRVDIGVTHVSRSQAENLLLSNLPNMCAGLLYSWASAHMYALSEIPHLGAMDTVPPRCDMI